MSIEVNDLTFSYGDHPVLKGVSFHADEGSFVAVLGRNGAGKTTMFRCILGFMQNYGGTIKLNGRDVRACSPRELASAAAYIPQNHPHSFSFSVLEMVLMGTTHAAGLFSMPGKREHDAAYAALEQMGIAQLARKAYSKLSGGEQQLVLAARALAQGGRILIMDEPASALDFGNRSMVMKKIRELADQGYTILLSTHDPQQTLWYADSVLALADGAAAAYGPVSEVLTSELLCRLYDANVSIIDTQRGPVILPAD